MNLSEICIRRPVFATVLSLVILLVGLISYDRLAVREYPRIDEPSSASPPNTAAPPPKSSNPR
jgi:multidrug efflux pump